MDIILSRKSTRKFTQELINEETIEYLLRAAMQAPSAGNEQPWEFIVINDRKLMKAITEYHPYSQMLLQANLAIVVCGDMEKERFKGYWVQDCSAASENILLAAENKGLGAVWVGVYPEEDRIIKTKIFLELPESVILLSIIALGYPAEERVATDRFIRERIHYNKW